MSGFKLVGDVEADPPPPHQAQAQQATRLLLTALAALSQRAVVAIASLFSLVLAGSVFWLALSVAQAPTDRQIGVLALYAAFVVVLHVVRRRA
jgi:flagellar biosynthesis protein FliP